MGQAAAAGTTVATGLWMADISRPVRVLRFALHTLGVANLGTLLRSNAAVLARCTSGLVLHSHRCRDDAADACR